MHFLLTASVVFFPAAGLEGDDNVDPSNAGRGKVIGQGVVFSTWRLVDGSAARFGVESASVSVPSSDKMADLGN